MTFDRNRGENQLDLDDIQGDVLVGLQKDFELFVGFSIADAAAFRTFLSILIPRITTLRTTLEREFILNMRHHAAQKEVFTFIGTNIGFTAAGLKALGIPDLDKIRDTSFLAGLATRSGSLNDPTSGIGAPENWVIGGPGQDLHGLLIITGPDQSSVHTQLDRINGLAGSSWTRLGNTLEGSTRRQNRGHEHFGFLDGVSQPGVRGQINSAFPSHKFLTPSENSDDAGQGKPGQDLLWPGEFVFGYPSQKPDDVDAPGDVRDGGLSWMKNGSFMVFRRLKQLVPEFEAFCDDQAAVLETDAGLIAARMVGRWPSGAPLVTSPLQDNAALAKDDRLVNAFEFTQDKLGRRCRSPHTFASPIPATTLRRLLTQARQSPSSAKYPNRPPRRIGLFEPAFLSETIRRMTSRKKRGLCMIAASCSSAIKHRLPTNSNSYKALGSTIPHFRRRLVLSAAKMRSLVRQRGHRGSVNSSAPVRNTPRVRVAAPSICPPISSFRPGEVISLCRRSIRWPTLLPCKATSTTSRTSGNGIRS